MMTDTTTKILFCILILLMLTVFHMNWRDIENCKQQGKTEQECIRIYNP